MDMDNYIIAEARNAYQIDSAFATACIVTGKTLYPNSFSIQFEAYQIEKQEQNYRAAADCFTHMMVNFKPSSMDIWNEISSITAALRTTEGTVTKDQQFYVKMFEYVSHDIQQKILLFTAGNSGSIFEHCKLILLLLRRFPKAVSTHLPTLLETILQGTSSESPEKFHEIVVQEVPPLLLSKNIKLPNHAICSLYTICLEYYTKQIFEQHQDNDECAADCFKHIFDILKLCGQILSWEPFLPYNKAWSKDVYWQKLLQIIAKFESDASESKQIFFYATTLFIASLHSYMSYIKRKSNDRETEFVLVEGFRDDFRSSDSIIKEEDAAESPHVSVFPPCNSHAPTAFVTAAHCWHILNSKEKIQVCFSQLLIKLPLANWISTFLFDLAVYFGHHDEAVKLLNDVNSETLQYNVRMLSINLGQGTLKIHGFERILKILAELPERHGNPIRNLSIPRHQRHLLLLPMTRKAVQHYCVKAIINRLEVKIFNVECSDMILGNLIVFLQVAPFCEEFLIERVFSLINDKKHFIYPLFATYIIHIEFLEEFMKVWLSQNKEFNIELLSSVSARRIATRGADKEVQEDFKQIMLQQVCRSNEDIYNLLLQFITTEHIQIMQNLF